MSMPAEQMTTDLTLDALLDGIVDAPAMTVTGIAIDSRKVQPGDAFLAVQGASNHGLDFLADVIAGGAVAVVYDAATANDVPSSAAIPLIAANNLAGRLGEVVDRFFGAPSSDVGVIGVTGTNGKSTVAWLIAQCFQRLGKSCAYSGTLGYGVGELDRDDDLTSPDVVENHRRLAKFRALNASHAAIEVSSHALDQARVAGLRFDATLFTNLTRDHLDYHGGMRAYGRAKARLFIDYPARVRIVNLDSEFGTELASRCRGDVITVSTRFDRVANGRPYVFVRGVVAKGFGSEVRIASSWGETVLSVPLVGDFNVANAVLVLAYLLASDIELDAAANALSEVSAPPGRMQRVRSTAGPAVFVDYAHTPDALSVVLKALRPHARGALWVVFGCGGDRDAGKRPQMGGVAERHADRVVVTSDNPRGEDPAAIIDDILQGIGARPDKGAQRDDETPAVTVIEDRAAAIAWAIDNAGDDDAVLVAGKGHESYQIVAGERIAFSDYGAALGNLSVEAHE